MRTRSRKQREDDFSHQGPAFLRLYRGRAATHIAPGFAFSGIQRHVKCAGLDLLTVVGILPMFSLIMLIHNIIWQKIAIWI